MKTSKNVQVADLAEAIAAPAPDRDRELAGALTYAWFAMRRHHKDLDGAWDSLDTLLDAIVRNDVHAMALANALIRVHRDWGGDLEYLNANEEILSRLLTERPLEFPTKPRTKARKGR